MNGLIVDTNILFAALRSEASLTRRQLLKQTVPLYAPNYIIGELFNHQSRWLSKGKSSSAQTTELMFKLMSKITFINEAQISTPNFIAAYRLCRGIDENDTPFVALSLELGCPFWTRDEKLKTGLIKAGFRNFYEES